MTYFEAKKRLEGLIKKTRVHAYKPIQIAEILFRHRTRPDLGIDLSKKETYRTQSKKWRDEITSEYLHSVCSSSARFQDNLFEENAIPPQVLVELGKENLRTDGCVEKHIYDSFIGKQSQLDNALTYCLGSTSRTFNLSKFIGMFWDEPGLKRSVDKIFEIIVYALFESIIRGIELKVDVYYPEKSKGLIQEFDKFSTKVLGLDHRKTRDTLDAHFYRVGVTNAADRGLDIYANFGSAIQIKHLDLNAELAEGIVSTVSSEKVIIVCKSVEEIVIKSVLTQIGWGHRIQSIISIEELHDWYEKALRGEFSESIGDQTLENLRSEIKSEFPSVGASEFQKFMRKRGYL